MTAFFPDVAPIKFEGPESRNPLAFRWYDPDRVVLGKSMRDHFRFAVCYWHTLCWPGSDMFGPGTFGRPWQSADTVETATQKLEVAFEFFQKLGAPFFCFHDADVVPLGNSLKEGWANLDHMADLIAKKMQATGVKLLWGTA